METRIKLKVLADAAKYDASCASSGVKRRGNGLGVGNSDGTGICHSYTPDGRCVSLLKILLTNYCIYDCQYCVNRVSSDVERARFTVDEVVNLTLEFYKRNYIEGLFLSSGIIQSPDYTMERLSEVAGKLRVEHHFGGYIHLKAVPGASPELIEKAGRHADRLSANIELPREQDLERFAPEKKTADVEATMHDIERGIAEARDAARTARSDAAKRDAPRFAPAGQSTQMIVGATDATDRDSLDAANRLYTNHRLKRVYYSAFSPIPHGDPRLPAAAPPLLREHRMYQADWLIRQYGYSHEELTTADEPNLDTDLDPKHLWALRHPERFPVDVNTADRESILRIPGVGVRNADRILKARRWRRLRLADLKKLRVAMNRAKPFVETADHRGDATILDAENPRVKILTPDRQLQLF